MTNELYIILNKIFVLSEPIFTGIVEKIDYVGYEKTVYEKGRHYLNQYNDVNDREINFGITDEAIDFQNNYAYIYVRSTYSIDTKLHPNWTETVNLRIVLCSFKNDIENHSRDFWAAFINRFAQTRSQLPSVFGINFVEMNINKEKIFSEETAKGIEEMTMNNAIQLATFDFKMVYSYNKC